MDMPGYQDYGKILDMNPYAAYQANQQIGLAQQFQDQKYQQEQNTTQKGTLENQFTAQDNPNRVQERILNNQGKELTNSGLDMTNQTAQLKLEREKANQGNLLDEQQRAAALKMSEDKLKEWDQHVTTLMQSTNPQERLEGARLQTYLSSYQLERRKAKDAQDLAAVAPSISAKSNKEIAQMNIDAGRWNKKGSGGLLFSQSLSKMKVPEQLSALSGILSTGIDPDTDAELSPAARQFYQAMYDQGGATLNASNQARGNGGAGIVPQVQGNGGIKLENRPPVSVVPGANKPKLPAGVTIVGQ